MRTLAVHLEHGCERLIYQPRTHSCPQSFTILSFRSTNFTLHCVRPWLADTSKCFKFTQVIDLPLPMLWCVRFNMAMASYI